jgi:mannose-1-phosphate guanylyltransferase
LNENTYAVIMAGGGGTRLWPLSRQAKPKQMLPLIEDRTLFQTAVQRLSGLFPPERILVVTSREQSEELKKQSPELPASNFMLEPQPRGTAAAIGLASARLQAEHPEAIMVILTADHYIGNEAEFHSHLESAVELAEQGKLVTLGIEPTYVATQYGYIQLGESLGKHGDYETYEVKRFKEKPNKEEAERMIAGADHTWNSGMFIWKAQRIWEEFERQMPDLHSALVKIQKAWGTSKFEDVLGYEWPRIAAQTIDYGVMEKAKDVAVIPAKNMAWNDVGSWSSLFEVLELDEAGNLIIGEKYLGIDSKNSLVHSNGQERMVVTVGVNDLVIVDTGDVLLICSKERSQDLRKVIEHLKENGLQNYL